MICWQQKIAKVNRYLWLNLVRLVNESHFFELGQCLHLPLTTVRSDRFKWSHKLQNNFIERFKKQFASVEGDKLTYEGFDQSRKFLRCEGPFKMSWWCSGSDDMGFEPNRRESRNCLDHLLAHKRIAKLPSIFLRQALKDTYFQYGF